MAKSAIKLYVISLSSTDSKINFKAHESDGGLKDLESGEREVELAMLTSLLDYSANSEKSLEKSLELLDSKVMIENIEDDETEIEFDKGTLDAIKKAYEDIAGRRPGVWLKCRSLLRQIANPKKKEDSKVDDCKD